jgi:energy-coupling factor transporter transmembrane protein EcfT
MFQKKNVKTDLINNEKITTKRRNLVETFKAGRLAEEAISQCRSWIDKFGPRKVGSPSCLNVAGEIKEELGKYCDFTNTQQFSIKPKAYTFWLTLIPFVYLIGLFFLLVGLPVTALIFYGVYFTYVYMEFIKYKPIGEKYFKSEKGYNIHGVIEPKGEVLHTILFTSHHDSALLPTVDRNDNKNYLKKVTIPLVLFGASSLLIVVQLFTEIFTGRFFAIGFPPVTSIVFIAILFGLSFFVFHLQHFFSEEATPGAGDNLISCATIIQIARYFDWKKKNEGQLEHTRLIFCSFDGEEVGLRGSRVWFDKYPALLKDAMQINLDCLYKADELVFLDTDINGTQPLSSKLAQKGVKLAVGMGYNAKMHHMPFLAGGTDAAEGYRAGIQSISLMALNFKDITATHLHSRSDVVDNIEVKAIEQVISIAIKMAGVIDRDNIDDESFVVDEKDNDQEDKEKELELTFSKLSRR